MFKSISATIATLAFQCNAQADIGGLTTVEYNTIIAGIGYGIVGQNDCETL
jgi:hypothetical protein